MGDWPSQGCTSTEVASENIATENTYQQLIAACAAPVKRAVLVGNIRTPSVSGAFDIYLATGAGGSEVVCGNAYVTLTTPVLDDPAHSADFTIIVDRDFPTGTRFAMKYDNDGGSATCTLAAGLTLSERAS